MSQFEGSHWGGWPQEVSEERLMLVPTLVKTNLEGAVGSPGQREWALIRGYDSAGCTGCGSLVLPRGVSSWEGTCQSHKYPLGCQQADFSATWEAFSRAERLCVAVISSSGGETDTQAHVPSPSLPELSGLLFCSQLFSV